MTARRPRDGREPPPGVDLTALAEKQRGDSLGGSYALTDAQGEAYRRDGHALILGLLSPAECAMLRAAVTSAVGETDMARSMAVLTPGKHGGHLGPFLTFMYSPE